VVLPAVSACAIALAACGSSSRPPTAAAGLNRSVTTTQRAALEFAECMRAHGVGNFPDPTSNGRAPADHVNKHAPAFQTAVRACHPQMAALADLKPKTSRARELREAECMRTHGVPNFPDPLPGGGYEYSGSINPNSPAFQRASNQCQKPK